MTCHGIDFKAVLGRTAPRPENWIIFLLEISSFFMVMG